MNALQTFHQAHKERVARIEARAYRPSVVVVPEPEPLDPPRTEEIKPRPVWFRILGLAQPTIRDIQAVVAEFYDHNLHALISPRKEMPLCRHRQIAMFLAKDLTQKSLPEIGRSFAGRDHTTILHGVRKIAKLMASDPELADEIEEIKRRIGTL